MQLKNKILLYLLLTIIEIKEIKSFKCSSKDINITPGILETVNKNKKRRIEGEENNTQEKEEEEEEEFQKFIIGYDYYSFNNSNEVDEDTKNQLRTLLEDVSSIFSNLLSAKSVKVHIDEKSLKGLINARCKLNETSENISDIINENSITIFPVFKEFGEDESDISMIGKYCLITRDMIIKGGILYINKNINFTKENSYLYYKHILFHEMTHILIFEPNLMDGLGLLKDNKVISPRVRKLAEIHFNCKKFNDDENFGVPLEEDGLHWDARYMLGDYMISFDYYDKSISDITFALFDDSGLYNVDYLYGKYFNFGKNKSCSFFEKNCIENENPNFDEFCAKNNEPKCSQSRLNKGICSIHQYSENISNEYQYFNNSQIGGIKEIDFCPVSNYSNQNYFFSTNCKISNESPNAIYGEKFGHDSFCFISSLTSNDSEVINEDNSICYEVECEYITKTIIVKVNGTKVNCSMDGGIVSDPQGFKGNLSCPKYHEICEFKNSEICTDMFDCINENFSRNYTYDDFDSSYFIKYKFLLFSILFIIIF